MLTTAKAKATSVSSGHLHCNRSYILFTKLPWPEDSEGTFRSSSQDASHHLSAFFYCEQTLFHELIVFNKS